MINNARRHQEDRSGIRNAVKERCSGAAEIRTTERPPRHSLRLVSPNDSTLNATFVGIAGGSTPINTLAANPGTGNLCSDQAESSTVHSPRTVALRHGFRSDDGARRQAGRIGGALNAW